MNKTVVGILDGGRELIADPQNWRAGVYATVEGGDPYDDTAKVSNLDPRAKCFCMIGATARIAGVDPDREARDKNPAYDSACDALAIASRARIGDDGLAALLKDHDGTLEDVNDNSEHDDVLSIMKDASALAMSFSPSELAEEAMRIGWDDIGGFLTLEKSE